MRYKNLSVVLFLLTVIFILLVQLNIFKEIDLLLNGWSYSLSNPVTDVFWRMFTVLSDTEILAVLSLLILVYLFYQKKVIEIILYLFLMSSGIMITFVLKILLQRERPGDVEYIDFWGLGKDIVSYSLPSGHAVKSLLLFGFVLWFIQQNYHHNRYTLILSTLLVFIIIFCGIGQMFLNEHYMSDIIGGYLVGFTVFSFSFWLYRVRFPMSYIR
ncbi:phosphatase PAP2 family protein [Ornithinibacillus scapharcae]|uniref:phosphatase PAP2 family protein n=1 Tax=Ornithinibacillus scapharcae TaxID=1147159 RepID=UPI000225B648|nr:phosphatase PAP2 family protein [Ornithinibacillus scapharcae]